MKLRLSKAPSSPYKEFMLHTKKGQRRLREWVSLAMRGLAGETKMFYKDEERMGYLRALQGYPADFSFRVHQSLAQTTAELFREEINQKGEKVLQYWEEVQRLIDLLFKGFGIIATSYLQTREDLITEKVTYLQEIYNFTQEIITIFDLEQILNLTLKKLAALFQVEKSLLLLYRDRRIQGIYSHPLILKIYGLRLIMEKTLQAGIPVFLYKGKEISHDINRSPFKLAVSIPIQAHDRRYGVLALCNKRSRFKFTEIEMELLLEFLYILAVALENAFMVDEIEKSRKELHLLTGKMITIQEEERKRLAADIHDTLAQALTGISYKIQFCMELAHKNPRLLTDQLDGLIRTVNQTIDQTKELMTSLRPDLIDTIGLVPALKRHLSNFARETGIQVTTYFPQKIQMSSELNICLFRIAQEALTNVYKHAKAKTAEVRLQKDKGSAILIVADQGKGFDMGSVLPWTKDQNKMGLLSMKERVEAVGGSFTIQAEPNQGCRVEARVPLN